MRAAGLWTLALLLALPAAAQHMHHGEDVAAQPAQVVIDVADQDVVAGHPATFAILLLTEAGEPRVHQDMRIRASFAGTVLFEAPAATGHDYDGLNELTVTFPSAGPWTVELLDDGGASLARLEGWAIAKPQEHAVAHFEGPANASVGEPVEYRIWPADPDGRYVKHFYTLFEAWDEEGLALQAKLHGHNDDQVNESVVQLGFPHPGRWLLRAHMFQSAVYGPQIYSFDPLTAELSVEVTGTSLAGASMPGEPAPQVRNGTAPKALVATLDPQPQPGRSTPLRLAVRAVGNESALRTHIDFAGTLSDAAGHVLFATDRLHESDGLLQVLARPGLPGDYLWSVVSEGNGTRMDVPFRVLPDGSPSRAKVSVELPGFVAGEPAQVTLAVADGAGAPLAHAEVGLEVLDAAGRLQVAAKLHTHDGRLPFTLTMLDAGNHTLRLTPATLGQEDVAGAVRDVAFEAATGEAWPVIEKPEPEPAAAPSDGAGNPLPPLAWRAAAAVVVLGLGATATVAVWRRLR